MTQAGFATALREAGAALGEENDASTRLVQRWESGEIGCPHPVHQKALQAVTGRPVSQLGFRVQPFVSVPSGPEGEAELLPVTMYGPKTVIPQAGGPFTGIWRSEYKYPSSGRNAELVGLHYVVIVQHGSSLSVQSLPNGSLNPNSPLRMDLEVDRHIITGTWTEETAKDGYYRGAVYHGAIQMLVEPTGRRMEGQWVGYGKEFEINTGPWRLVFETPDTGKNSLREYNRPPSIDA